MHVAEVMDLLNTIEDHVPVDAWKIGGISAWPLARHDIFGALEDDAVAVAGRARSTGRLRRAAERVAADVRGRLLAEVQDRQGQAKAPTAQGALLLGDGFRAEFDGTWYDEFAEPLEPAFVAAGLEPYLVEYGGRIPLPRHGPSRLVQVEFDVLTAAARARSRLRPAASLLPGVDEAQAILLRVAAPAGALQEGRLRARMTALDAIARLLGARMRAIDARVAMAANMGLYGMALHLAARRRGIPSLDLQHGVQSDLHWAYARWARVPARGYDLLPRAFWVWREAEAATIRAWAGTDGPHQVVVGGNRWLEMWRTEPSPAAARLLATAAARRRELGAGTNVIVTFSTGWTSDFLALVEASIARSPRDWGWWVRSRVTMPAAERQALRARFSGRTNVEYDLAGSLPLHAILANVDANLTTSSTTVVEAEAFGVPSVVTDPVGLEIFPELASSGWVVHAAGEADVVAALRAQVDRRRGLPRVWTPPDRAATAVIREILALGPAEQRPGAAA